jgi:hypothetical protein
MRGSVGWPEPTVIANTSLGAVTEPFRQASSKDLSYRGRWRRFCAG